YQDRSFLLYKNGEIHFLNQELTLEPLTHESPAEEAFIHKVFSIIEKTDAGEQLIIYGQTANGLLHMAPASSKKGMAYHVSQPFLQGTDFSNAIVTVPENYLNIVLPEMGLQLRTYVPLTEGLPTSDEDFAWEFIEGEEEI